MIELHRVSKRYGRVMALTDLSLHIRPGEICFLLGPNGAGKSTALRLVMGLIHPCSGNVTIEGVSVRSPRIHEVRRRAGYLPQHSPLYEHLTGNEFLRFLAALYGAKKSAVLEAQKLLRKLGMREDSDRLIRTYSIGMKRRVALVASVLNDPTHLIMDEPTASLDSRGVQMVEALLRRYRAGGGAIVLATHRIDLADRLADSLCVLREGHAVFRGSPRELRAMHGYTPGDPLEALLSRLVTEGTEAPGAVTGQLCGHMSTHPERSGL